ncbi:MAG: alpha/beta hydrolase [Kiloniellales bacterium]|nr:alpha/beta hydrolase [Kiloniellales bacterium]
MSPLTRRGSRLGRRLRRGLLAVALLAAVGAAAFAETQLWQDREFTAGWRLQVQAVTGRCRVLDPAGAAAERGFGEACRAAYLALRPEESAGELVILLHGLGRTPRMFHDLQPALESEGRQVIALRYPSLTAGIEAHGRWLNALLDRHPQVSRVSFVTHSLGGLVLRAALARDPAWRARVALGPVVMLAPPNQGALIARRLDRWTPTRFVLGPSFAELAEGKPLPAALPAEVALGIIAGGCCAGEGYNPLLPGDDDGVVRVVETPLDGGDAALRVEALHTFIARNGDAIAATRGFLDGGRLLPASKTDDF